MAKWLSLFWGQKTRPQNESTYLYEGVLNRESWPKFNTNDTNTYKNGVCRHILVPFLYDFVWLIRFGGGFLDPKSGQPFGHHRYRKKIKAPKDRRNWHTCEILSPPYKIAPGVFEWCHTFLRSLSILTPVFESFHCGGQHRQGATMEYRWKTIFRNVTSFWVHLPPLIILSTIFLWCRMKIV